MHISAEKQVKLLGIHSGALGDVVLFAQLLGELGGRITLAAGGEKVRLLKGLAAIDVAIDFDALPMHELFADSPPEQCRLHELLGGHDRLISCFAAGNPEAEMRLAAICSVDHWTMLPVRPDDNYRGHLVDLWREILKLPGKTPPEPRRWVVPDEWRTEAAQAMRLCGIGSGRHFTLIHPGAGGANKCWPLERFVELARLVQQDGDARAVFVIGPVECDRWPAELIEDIQSRFTALICPPLTTLAGAMALSTAMVGNDSGPAHLAAALGVATVAMFGPTRHEQFAPRGRAVVTVDDESLDSIQAGRVFEAVHAASALADRTD